jgi:hypothetical protein
MGALRREGRDDLMLVPMKKLYRRLTERPGVREKIITMSPDRDEKVLSLVDSPSGKTQDTSCPEPDTHGREPVTSGLIYRTMGDLNERMELDVPMRNKKEYLSTIIELSNKETNTVRTRRLERDSSPPKVKKDRSKTAAGMGEYLRSRVKGSLESVYQPTITKQDLALLKKLKDETDAETVIKVIDFVTTPDHWKKFRKKCRINSMVPTVSVIWGFRATLIPMALGQQDGPRRSGGAEDVKPSVRKDDSQDPDGYFS